MQAPVSVYILLQDQKQVGDVSEIPELRKLMNQSI